MIQEGGMGLAHINFVFDRAGLTILINQFNRNQILRNQYRSLINLHFDEPLKYGKPRSYT